MCKHHEWHKFYGSSDWVYSDLGDYMYTTIIPARAECLMTDLDVAYYALSHINQWGLWAACRFAKNRGVRAEILINLMRTMK